MKILLSIVFFFAIIHNSFAQDLIIKINADTIYAKILDISENEIRYKRFDFQDGPVYIENKSEVKSIIFFNGVKEVYQDQENKPVPNKYTDLYNLDSQKSNNKIEMIGNQYIYKNRKLNEAGINEVLLKSNQPEINKLCKEVKFAKKMQLIGFGAIPLGMCAAYYGTEYLIGNNKAQSINFIVEDLFITGGLACIITSISYNHKRKALTKHAVNLYNQKF